MTLVTILCIIIAVLSVALIIVIIALIVQRRKLRNSNQQLKWYNMSNHY